MGDQYLSEIRIMAFNFPPKGWLQCNGQILPINQYQALFALLGTTYGGNGVSNFALPDLRGRAALHFGQSYALGQSAGEPAHTLTLNETPTHNHTLRAANFAADPAPAGVNPGPTVALAQAAAFEGQGAPTLPVSIYSTAAANSQLSPNALGLQGGNQAHENRQPFLALNFCISLTGIFPSQN